MNDSKGKSEEAELTLQKTDSVENEDVIVQKQKAVMKELNEAPVSIDEIDNLKELTHTKEIEIAGGDLAAHVRKYESGLKDNKRETYYHDIIFALVQIRLPEEDAKKDWHEILVHKNAISEKLGRNVGIHVAVLDYYTNIKRYVRNPKILDATEYADTASHAISDELTRAYNRRFFDREFNRLFRFCDAFGTIFSLIMLDMDHFKMYNDVNGHIKGDIALLQTVRIFHAVSGPKARVCRYGGEEFAVLLPDQSLLKALEIAENIRKAVEEFRFVNEHPLPKNRMTVSGGIVEFHSSFTNAESMLDEADKALYRAKNTGRNWMECAPGQELYGKSND